MWFVDARTSKSRRARIGAAGQPAVASSTWSNDCRIQDQIWRTQSMCIIQYIHNVTSWRNRGREREGTPRYIDKLRRRRLGQPVMATRVQIKSDTWIRFMHACTLSVPHASSSSFFFFGNGLRGARIWLLKFPYLTTAFSLLNIMQGRM